MTALTFSASPRILADGATVSTIAASSWGSRSDGLADGDVLRVTDTGMSYIWSESLARWVVPEMYALTCTQLATVAGDSATLGDEGWTVGGSNAGTTTSDGTRVTVEISGTTSSVSEVWNLTTAPTLASTVYISGYLGFGLPAFGQSIIQCLRGVDYFTLARNSAIATGGTPIVVRGTASTAFRQSEYASALADADEHWWDIVLPEGGTSGQLRIYMDHRPWFGCGMSQIPGGSSLNSLQIGCNPISTGTRDTSMTLRDFAVIEGA